MACIPGYDCPGDPYYDDGDDGGGGTEDPDPGDSESSWTDLPGIGEGEGGVGTFLVTFAKNPKNVILGTFLGVLITGIENLWTTLLDALTLLWWGDNIDTTADRWGLADIPVIFAEAIIDAFSPVASSILGLVDGMYDGLAAMFTGLGPLAFPVAVAAIMGVIILTERLAKRLGPALLDAIPVVGPALKTLLMGP